MTLIKQIRVPHESVNDEFLNVIRLPFKTGDKINPSDVVIDLETSKANISLEAEVNGFIKYLCKESDEVKINSLIIEIFDNADECFQVKQELQETFSKVKENDIAQIAIGETIFSQKAIELIEKHGLNKSLFTGKDLINANDVLAILNPDEQLAQNKKIGSLTFSENIDLSNITRKKISKQKKREIEYLSIIQSAGLTSSVSVLINTNGIMPSIKNQLKYFKDSILPITLYEVSKLLLKYSELNAFYNDNEIFYYNQINIGIAIDINDGLKTVNLRNVNELSVGSIEETLYSLANKYVDKKLEIKDLSDITFTITDLSAENVHSFLPLINKNNSAILGINTADTKGNLILSVTFDHRVTEGKRVANFLNELKARLESYKNTNVPNIEGITCFKCLKKLSADFSNFGFLKVIDKNGQEKYLCQTCFKGL